MKRVIVCVLVMAALAAGQQASGPPAKSENRPPVASVDQQEVQALTNDVARMRTLLQQMEMNLAFVQTTQTPLKHQFDLEIDMWRVMLNGMERRLQRLRTTTSGVASPGTVPLRQDSRQGRP
jgi:TolA-binding protein